MTVSAASNKHTYSGNGVTTLFSYTFKLIDADDLEVFLTDTDGVDQDPLSSNYSVDETNMRVTYPSVGSPLPTGWKITLRRVLALEQDLDLKNQGAFNAENIEIAFDRAVMRDQQQNEENARSIKFQASSNTTGVFVPDPEPSKALVWNAAGDNLENGPSAADIAGANASAVAAAASEAAAAASEAAAASSETNAGASETAAAASQVAAAASAAAAAASASAASTSQSAAATSASGAATSASGASTSASAASTSASAAAASQAAAAASATAASGSATNAATSETNAASSASSAATSASAAATAAAAAIWRDVVFITVANTPYTIDSTHRGKLICVDASGGAVAITLPQISGLSLATPYNIGIKKTDSSGNAVTVSRAGTDTIDGATSKVISVADSGATFVPDTDPAPDEWTTADFGAQAGNLTVDRFSGNGSTTGFTLSVDPGSANNASVYVSGVYQQKNTYSVSGTTLTFTSAPPTGTNNVEVVIGTTLSIGTPADGSVTPLKMAASAHGAQSLANLGLSASVASNALTIALKTAAGADASSTDPVKIGFRSATAGTGTANIRSITAALSTVISSGSTAGHTSAVNQYLYVYAIDNAGTVELAWSSTYIDEGALATTTAEGGAGAADSYTTLYSTTARTSVPIRLIGRFKVNQTVAGTWAAVPTEISLAPFQPSSSWHEIRLDTHAGYGSTDTKIPYFTTTSTVGSALSLTTNNATNGASVTVNEDGLYATTFHVNGSSGGRAVAVISKNADGTDRTTNGTALGITKVLQRMFGAVVAANDNVGFAAWVGWLRAGDVVRPHMDGVAPSGTTLFTIVQLKR